MGLLYQKLRNKPEAEMSIKRLIGMIFFHISNILKNKKNEIWFRSVFLRSED